jgi:predicted nucleotidyltransferase
MIRQSILTKAEEKVVNKKLNNEKLTKQDSYYLSVSIRPKLKQAIELVNKNILKRIDYNQKAVSIENKIRNIILERIKNVQAIVLYGSAIQTNYAEYKDIDLLIVTKAETWVNKWEKLKIINEIEKKSKDIHLNLDIQILDIKAIKESYSSNLSLIYQLKDSKVIYGKLEIPKKIELPKIVLKMKMDWSELISNPSSEEIYNCIRNTLLIRLILRKIVDNFYLSNCLVEELGKNLMTNLKENKATDIEKKIAVTYLKGINSSTLNEIEDSKWEKIVI